MKWIKGNYEMSSTIQTYLFSKFHKPVAAACAEETNVYAVQNSVANFQATSELNIFMKFLQ